MERKIPTKARCRRRCGFIVRRFSCYYASALLHCATYCHSIQISRLASSDTNDVPVLVENIEGLEERSKRKQTRACVCASCLTRRGLSVQSRICGDVRAPVRGAACLGEPWEVAERRRGLWASCFASCPTSHHILQIMSPYHLELSVT